MRALVLALLLAACGEGTPTDCACTINVGDETLTLGCGEQGCIGGASYGCTEDYVMPLGRCGGDLAGASTMDVDGGQCLVPQASCDGQALSCCAIATDAGPISPVCDGVSRRCCVPAGERCATSADCCSARPCLPMGPDGQEQRCSS